MRLLQYLVPGFGDGYYKLSKGLFGDLQHRKFIEILSSLEPASSGKISMISQYSVMFYAYKTPPYITAHPESASRQFQDGDIVIMATDGLWDLVSSTEAVEIVLRGLTQNEPDLAKYLLTQVKQFKSPGDDITVIVIQIRSFIE